jgi:hypothetical protein
VENAKRRKGIRRTRRKENGMKVNNIIEREEAKDEREIG